MFFTSKSPKKATLFPLELRAVECIYIVIRDSATYQNKDQPGTNISLQGRVLQIEPSCDVPSGGYNKRNVFLTCTLSWQMISFITRFLSVFLFTTTISTHENAAPSLSTVFHVSACGYATLLQPSSRDDESEVPTPFLCTAVAIITLGVSRQRSPWNTHLHFWSGTPIFHVTTILQQFTGTPNLTLTNTIVLTCLRSSKV